MPCFLIVYRNSTNASLFKMCFLMVIPFCLILVIRLLYALHILPDVLFFMDLMRMRFPSVLQKTIMYLFPWLDITGRSVYIMSSILTCTSCTLGVANRLPGVLVHRSLVLFIALLVCFGAYVLFEFHVILDFMTAVAVSIGHVA